jgi:hypothetical protein
MAKNNAQTTNKDHGGIINSDKQEKVKNFDLVVDGVPYTIKSIPFHFNSELRFRIILNGTSEHVFTWDSEVGMLRAINDDSSILPAGLEEALSEKLQGQLK